MTLRSLWQKYVPNWKVLLRRCMPYAMVAVFASATVVAALGAQDVKQAFIIVDSAKVELASQKEELESALTLTQTLLGQLNSVNTDTKTLLEQAQTEGSEVSDKIEELQTVFNNIENKEQQRWILPIQYKVCSSPYGYRDHPIGGSFSFHDGVDLAADRGTPIVASRSGTVEIATYQEESAGHYVVIDHLDGYDSRYMHMTKYIVTEGQFVLAGQIIGYCGDSGAATGNHLHFCIFKDNQSVNPADYIDLY